MLAELIAGLGGVALHAAGLAFVAPGDGRADGVFVSSARQDRPPPVSSAHQDCADPPRPAAITRADRAIVCAVPESRRSGAVARRVLRWLITMTQLTAVILAAGEAKRMRSRRPKVLHHLCGRPLIAYPVRAARALGSPGRARRGPGGRRRAGGGSPEAGARLRRAEGAAGHRPRACCRRASPAATARAPSWCCRATCRCCPDATLERLVRPPRADRRGGHPADRRGGGRDRLRPRGAGGAAGRWASSSTATRRAAQRADPRDRHQRVLLRRARASGPRWTR